MRLLTVVYFTDTVDPIFIGNGSWKSSKYLYRAVQIRSKGG